MFSFLKLETESKRSSILLKRPSPPKVKNKPESIIFIFIIQLPLKAILIKATFNKKLNSLGIGPNLSTTPSLKNRISSFVLTRES